MNTTIGTLTESPTVQLSITKKLIDEAVVGDSSHCMVANAVKQAIPHARHVSADIQSIRFSDPSKGVRYIYLTPRKAQEAILSFDRGNKPKPFRTTIRNAHVTEMGKKKSPKKMVRRTKDGPRSTPMVVGGKPAPMGALSGTARTKATKKAAARKVGKLNQRRAGEATGRIGRRREFGLRAMVK